ncbi:hypothetical protein CLM85_24150 [Streptomyces albidoflavus]|nr:hypothetical protein CLM81_08490 [Streptomyces albidoflavus]PBO18719.1 hypothetical protein CLM83_10585 [Streptomyces albidoflavus]PBO22063.1 hypothetical protein CLM85_24150 [Streptomyces albidoflavus]PBO28031.1 hypothetical protein CLM84_22400 [Streptomyces albidoflavus]
MDFRGEHPPGVDAVAGQDAGGELLADLRPAEGAGGGGLRDQEDVHAQLPAHVEDLVERVEGRGGLRVAGLADLLPVAGQHLHRGVDLFEEDQQPLADGLGVGVDAQFVGEVGTAPAFLPEGDELVVDVGDVGRRRCRGPTGGRSAWCRGRRRGCRGGASGRRCTAGSPTCRRRGRR